MRCISLCLIHTLCTYALADIYLRTNLVDKSQGITRPSQHPDCPNAATDLLPKLPTQAIPVKL